MAIDDYKVTNAEVQAAHVQAAPNTLTGTAQENKAVFDGYPELLKEKHNNLIDAIDDALSEKADSSDVEAALAEKADIDDVDTALAEKVDKIEGKGLSANDYTDADKALVGMVTNKVDKETGKGLSTNDYTTAEKMKLSGIAAGAEVNVQADWETNDPNSDAYIKNKPYIPNKTSDLTNDSNYATETYVENGLDGKVDKETGKGLSSNDYTTAEKTKLAGIGDGAEANVQSDWAQPDTTADDYIKNKPPVPTKTSDLTNDSDFTVSDGTYDAMTVGMSKQLDTNEYEADSVPYLFRKTGGTATAGDRELDKIVGGSVVFNQLINVPTSDVSKTQNGVTIVDNRDGTYTISTDENGATGDTYIALPPPQVINGHRYYFRSLTTNGATDTYYAYITSNVQQPYDYGNGSIGYARADGSTFPVPIFVKSGTVITTPIKVIPQLFDLTQMFGTTIADYVYQLEQNSAGSGVAYLKSLGYFTDDYYPYNSGEIKSVSGLDSHDMVGFNQWDVTKDELGKYNKSDGTLGTNANMNTSDYIRVVPNTAYYFKNVAPSGNAATIAEFDINKNFVRMQVISGASGTIVSGIKTTSNTTHYVRVTRLAVSSDNCINISDTNRNGEYEPYIKHSYPLDNTLTLRGIPKLSDGKLYYDGDEYNSDGSVVRKYGVVDLGSLNWTMYSTEQGALFRGALADVKYNPTVTTVPNLMCEDYPTTSFNGRSNLTISQAVNLHVVDIINDTYTSAADFKSAMQGVYLIYELAEPTTETAEPYSTIQLCDGAGTEEYVTTGIPVGHETKYPIDLKGKLEKIPLVEPPKTNGTYTLKCTVSGGVPSYSWV